ncbi:MAG: response regulator transcription factor [Deltaproteobacteria bacterium]|nr:response regulator transcription factor [Deltaproteobacteria bacterium]
MGPVRVLIAGVHRLVSEGIGGLLAGSFEVAGVAADDEERVGLARELKPDAGTPKLDGISALQDLKDEAVPSRAMILAASQAGISLD